MFGWQSLQMKPDMAYHCALVTPNWIVMWTSPTSTLWPPTLILTERQHLIRGMKAISTVADRNFDFRPVYQGESPWAVFRGGEPKSGLPECDMNVDARKIRGDWSARAQHPPADSRRGCVRSSPGTCRCRRRSIPATARCGSLSRRSCPRRGHPVQGPNHPHQVVPSA